MFQAVGYPRLNRFIVMLMGPVGLRLDRVFVDSFPDTWDLMLTWPSPATTPSRHATRTPRSRPSASIAS